ncbi:MAG: hypothetical protein AAF639_34115 [Chloroflexota bacterium]
MQEQDFLFKMPKTVKPKFVERFTDGSYLATISKKVVDPDNPTHDYGRKRWKTLSLMVRVIDVQVQGFQPYRLITSILDKPISAKEIAIHYHSRWDVEIAYDELKIHQLVTLRGQSPTLLRSKLAELVQQELYASFIMYNSIRRVMADAAHTHEKDPRFLSFKDVLHHLLDATLGNAAGLLSALAFALSPVALAQVKYRLHISDNEARYAYRRDLFVLAVGSDQTITILNDDKFRPKDFRS